jgi:carbohydrate-binding DOMON domain-containing protein
MFLSHPTRYFHQRNITSLLTLYVLGGLSVLNDGTTAGTVLASAYTTYGGRINNYKALDETCEFLNDCNALDSCTPVGSATVTTADNTTSISTTTLGTLTTTETNTITITATSFSEKIQTQTITEDETTTTAVIIIPEQNLHKH